jgi:hypothetical protein
MLFVLVLLLLGAAAVGVVAEDPSAAGFVAALQALAIALGILYVDAQPGSANHRLASGQRRLIVVLACASLSCLLLALALAAAGHPERWILGLALVIACFAGAVAVWLLLNAHPRGEKP